MQNSIDVFLPCRKGSERVKNKNIRPFGKYNYGLLERKLFQLKAIKRIRNIILSTNDKQIINWINKLKITNLVLDIRPEDLSSSKTKTDDLVKYSKDITDSDYILWTHVTSPFLTQEIYEDIIQNFFTNLKKGHDSLVTVRKIQKYIWNKNGPFNYDSKLHGSWPNTQNLRKLFEITSGVFLYPRISEFKYGRIGNAPIYYQTDLISSIDIDEEEDFNLASNILKFYQ